MSETDSQRYRAIFLSDVHLGTSGSKAPLLLEFLKRYDADTIYLIGDIIDGWRLKNGWHWPQSHNDVVQKLLRKVRKGARLIYVPGNHDEFLRDFVGLSFGYIELADRAIHQTATGKRYLVIHGDQFDVVIAHAKWLALLGDWAYEVALWSNEIVNRVRRRLGLPYWSLSAWAKMRVKNAVNFIGKFETTLAAEGRKAGVDGIICGHIHHCASLDFEGLHYLNSGDWVESCTAVAEDYEGRFHLIHFAEELNAEARATQDASSGASATEPLRAA